VAKRKPGRFRRFSGGSRPTLIQQSRAIPPSEKAGFAMEGRVRREFFALSKDDEDAIVQRIEAALDDAVKD